MSFFLVSVCFFVNGSFIILDFSVGHNKLFKIHKIFKKTRCETHTKKNCNKDELFQTTTETEILLGKSCCLSKSTTTKKKTEDNNGCLRCGAALLLLLLLLVYK